LQTYSFGVPRAHRELLADLAQLAEGEYNSLVTALGSPAPPTFRTEADFGGRIEGAVEKWDIDEATQLAIALTSMLQAASSHGIRQERFAKSISSSDDLTLDDAHREVLAKRLSELLSLPDVVLSGKALDLATEYERRLHTVRILTDVRPVWGSEPDDEPQGGIVIHQLRLDAFVGYDTQPYFIALDRTDLERMKDCVDRAIGKADSLAAWFDRMGFGEIDLIASDGPESVGDLGE
jgi:hypothetical protein